MEDLPDVEVIIVPIIIHIGDGSGASAAAAFKIGKVLQGRKVALVLTGGNLTLQTLKNIFKN